MSKYECCVHLGSRRDPDRSSFWVKSAEWDGDSVRINFSPEQCFIDFGLADSASQLLMLARNRPRRYICVNACRVDDVDEVEDSVLSAEKIREYGAFLRAYADIYGCDSIREFLPMVVPSEEVSADA